MPATGPARPAGLTPSSAQAPVQPGGFQYLSRFIARDPATGRVAHVMPVPGAGPSGGSPLAPVPDVVATPTVPLVYWGGQIQAVPRIYTVFWGTAWRNNDLSDGPGDPQHVRTRLKNFVKAVGGTPWLNDVIQYAQGNNFNFFNAFTAAPAGNPTDYFRGSWADTTNAVPAGTTQAQFAAEAERAAAYFGDYGPNVQYMIATPSGIVPPGFGTNFCAYHSWTWSTKNDLVPYTAFPYQPDVGCGNNWSPVNPGVLDGVSIVAGHEIAEVITDPIPQYPLVSNTLGGWVDVNNEEIGDKCAWVHIESIPMGTASYPVQPLWNNLKNSCRQYKGGGV